MSPAKIKFEEHQQFRKLWHWLLILGIPLLTLGVLTVMLSGGGKAGEMIVALSIASFGTFCLVLLMWFIRLTVRVVDDELDITFRPFAHRRVPLAEIETCNALTYRPLLDAGGWGMHYSFTGYGWAYNVYGRRGVALRLKNGKRLLVGSQRADELAAALCER